MNRHSGSSQSDDMDLITSEVTEHSSSHQCPEETDEFGLTISSCNSAAFDTCDIVNVTSKNELNSNMNWKSLFSAIIDDYSGYCTDLDSAIELVREFLKPSMCQIRFYLKKTHHKNFGKTEIPKKVIIQWDDQGHGTQIIPFDGVPFVYLNNKVWTCHLGINKVQSFASQPATGQSGSCPAAIVMKEVLKFPEYQITHDGEVARSWAMERLKRDFAYKTARGERRFYVRLPRPEDHANHTSDTDMYMWNPVNKVVQRKMRQLINSGVQTVDDLQRQLYLFVKTEVPLGSQISENNRSYYPSRQTMSELLRSFRSRTSKSQSAQKRLANTSTNSAPTKILRKQSTLRSLECSQFPDSLSSATDVECIGEQETSSDVDSWRAKCRDQLCTLISEVVDSVSSDTNMLEFVYGRVVECILVSRGEMDPNGPPPNIVVEEPSSRPHLNKSVQTSPPSTDCNSATVILLSDKNSGQDLVHRVCSSNEHAMSSRAITVAPVVYMSPEDVLALEHNKDVRPAPPRPQPFVLGAKPRRGRPPLSAGTARPPPSPPYVPAESLDYQQLHSSLELETAGAFVMIPSSESISPTFGVHESSMS